MTTDDTANIAMDILKMHATALGITISPELSPMDVAILIIARLSAGGIKAPKPMMGLDEFLTKLTADMEEFAAYWRIGQCKAETTDLCTTSVFPPLMTEPDWDSAFAEFIMNCQGVKRSPPTTVPPGAITDDIRG